MVRADLSRDIQGGGVEDDSSHVDRQPSKGEGELRRRRITISIQNIGYYGIWNTMISPPSNCVAKRKTHGLLQNALLFSPSGKTAVAAEENSFYDFTNFRLLVIQKFVLVYTKY